MEETKIQKTKQDHLWSHKFDNWSTSIGTAPTVIAQDHAKPPTCHHLPLHWSTGGSSRSLVAVTTTRDGGEGEGETRNLERTMAEVVLVDIVGDVVYVERFHHASSNPSPKQGVSLQPAQTIRQLTNVILWREQRTKP